MTERLTSLSFFHYLHAGHNFIIFKNYLLIVLEVSSKFPVDSPGRNRKLHCQRSSPPLEVFFVCLFPQPGIDFAVKVNFAEFYCLDHNKLWKILKEMGIPDHLTCLLRNLYAGQEAKIRTGHGTTDWFQIGKGVRQVCILSSCLFNLYAEYIMRRCTGLEEAQARINIAGGNINNLRYADDTTFMAERN